MAKAKRRIKHPRPAGGERLRGPVTGDDFQDTDGKPPVFGLYQMDKKWCITTCEQRERAAFASKLRVLSQLTWREIRSTHRHASGSEKIPWDAIRTGIPDNIPKDATFLAFRFQGRKSMVGHRERQIFHIIWIDRDFTLYEH